MYADIAIQIQGNTTTYDFKLRVVFPQAPFNALGRSGYQFVYPGDEIVVNNPAYFSFDVCGKTPQKVFATGLNEGTNSETTPLGFCDRPHQTVREATTIWDEGLKLISLRPWGLIEAERFFGAKMKITTPKGSFTVSFVKEETE